MENTCPFLGCPETFSSLLEARYHWTLCQFFLMDCPVSCGEKLLRRDLASHLTGACKHLFGSCQFCGEVLTRDFLQQHEVLCSQNVVSCKQKVLFCSKNPCSNEVCREAEQEEALDAYLSLLGSSVRDLSLEMSRCREKLDQINGRGEIKILQLLEEINSNINILLREGEAQGGEIKMQFPGLQLLEEINSNINILLREGEAQGGEIKRDTLQFPGLQLLEEINSNINILLREGEDLKTQQKEMADILPTMGQQYETTQAVPSQLPANQQHIWPVEDLTPILSHVEDISHQHSIELEDLKLNRDPINGSLGEMQGLERELQDTNEKLETVTTELHNTKAQLATVKTKLELAEEKVTKTQILNNNKEASIVNKEMQINKSATVKEEQQATKEEEPNKYCDAAAIKNPLGKMDLTLGTQNWFNGIPPFKRTEQLMKYLYGEDPLVSKLYFVTRFIWTDKHKVLQDGSEEEIRNINGTEYNVGKKWRVGREKIEVEVSFHQRSRGVNTLAQYRYFILDVSDKTEGVIINSVLAGQTCRYLIDTEKLEKYLSKSHWFIPSLILGKP